jgi:Outer membrane protein beta-barrel family
VTYLGYEEKLQELTIGKNMDIGNILLEEGAVNLEQVTVKEKIPMAQQLEDTTQYNASAFKTLSDATAEELIAKMPGVKIENGKVQAQGEDVKQVLVDGRPFFGNDATAALRNLPAEVISKIQVYDQQSEQTQFSGFQDGQTSKTINIITKSGMNNGQFGKVYAGYGYENKYQLGGNTNLFDGNRRISIIGQSNNINIQNFATDDLLGVVGSSGSGGGRGGRGGGSGGRRGGGGEGPSVNDFLVNANNGIATTNAIGLNYSDKIGKRIDVSGSYFFNWTDTDEKELLERTYVDGNSSGQLYTEDNLAQSTNQNHRINMRWKIDLDSMNTLIISPKLSMQWNDGNAQNLGETTNTEGLVNNSNNTFSSDLRGMNFSNGLTWRRKLAKQGRTISVSADTRYNSNQGDSEQYALNGFRVNNTFAIDTLDQIADLNSNGWNHSGRFSYTEPLGKNGQLSVDYRRSWQRDEADQKTYDFVSDENSYTSLNEGQSSVFNNTYTTQEFGGGYRYNLGKDLTLMARAFFQYAHLESEETFPLEDQISRNYYSVLPMAMLRYNFTKDHNLRVFYRSNTETPSVTQLQNVLNNNNPLSLSIGNPALDQSVQHRVGLRYSNTNTAKATVFFAYINANFAQQYIGNSSYLKETNNVLFDDIDLLPGAQLSTPVNLDGYYALSSFITYGLPVKPWKVNLNFELNNNYSRTPGLLNDALNYANNTTTGFGLTVSSNINDKVDFTVSSRSSFSQVNNTLVQSNDADYWIQSSALRFGWVLPLGIVIRSEMEHQYYEGLGDAFNADYLLWSAGIGKKLFANQRGELTLSVFDLLNQNRRVARNITDVYVEDVETNVLQRYVMLKFQYTFLNYNSGKVAAGKKEEERGWF